MPSTALRILAEIVALRGVVASRTLLRRCALRLTVSSLLLSELLTVISVSVSILLVGTVVG